MLAQDLASGSGGLMLLLLLLAFGSAALAGFATQRGSICAVHAVEDLFERRRATRFLGFFECALWVAAATAFLCLLTGTAPRLPEAHKLTLAGLAGGALFGVGAAVNGSCTFGSLARLSKGELSLLFFLPGFFLGAAAGELLPPEAQPMASLAAVERGASLATRTGLLTLALLACALLGLRLWLRWRAAGSPRLGLSVLLRPQWDPGLAMAVLGLASGPLYLFLGPWAYSAVLSAYARGERPAPLLAGLSLALMAGALLGGITARRFHFSAPRPLPALRCLGGGFLMGLGAALVPGGNDSLVLHGMPAFRPEAWLAYLAMLLGIAALVGPLRLLPRRAAAPRS